MNKPNRNTMLTLTFMLAAVALPAQGLAEDEFDEADVFFELNHTDGDLGIHALVDGEPWKRMRIYNEKNKKILDVRVKKALRAQGMTELFFESHEPDFEELPPAEFFARFPAGEYRIKGWLSEGGTIESMDDLTHVMPAPPDSVMVGGEAAAEDCDSELPLVLPPVTIEWGSVTLSHPDMGVMPPEAITVTRYQVVVEAETADGEYVLSVDLPSDVTEFTVPEDFTDLPAIDDEFKFEILVREESGNQTAIESCFERDTGE